MVPMAPTVPTPAAYEVGQWILVEYESHRFLGVITELVSAEAHIKCMEHAGPPTGNKWLFPDRLDEIWYDI